MLSFAIVVLLCGNELQGIIVEAVFWQVNILVCGLALFLFLYFHALQHSLIFVLRNHRKKYLLRLS